MPMRRLLILTHRWLGIPLSVLFVVWIVSGIVMMYAGGMPQLDPERRLDRLDPIDLGEVRLSAAEAAARARVSVSAPGATTLLTVTGRPAYRFGSGAYATTVFADNGDVLAPLGPEASREVAARFVGVPTEAVRFLRTVTQVDQWTLTLARELPLHKLAVDDGVGTEVYVSPQRGEAVLVTTTRTRALAWAGTIPHWFYITPLRTNQPLWYWTVVYASALASVLAALGLVLAVVQLRRSRPFRLSASIRYRGFMRLHYVFGALFGLFALTWAFSGLMSMEPFAWMNERGLAVRRDALSGGPLELEAFGRIDADRWTARLGGRPLKELELVRIHGEPYYVARTSPAAAAKDMLRRERLHQPYNISGRRASGELVIAANTLSVRDTPFATDEIVRRLTSVLPEGVRPANTVLLYDYDHYYYSRAGRLPLPVLRIELDDPLETWLYVDPSKSRIVSEVHRLSRLERWLFNGLHSLDFKFWHSRRPLWDIGMIVLSVGALASSGIGLALGLRRLGRTVARRTA